MKVNTRLKSMQAAVCLLSAIIVWRFGSDLEGTEFTGGRITGPLLDMKDVGSLLFIVALLLTFFYRRIAAVLLVLASALCLPLYLYFTAPGPFRRIVGGEYSVPLRANIVWDIGGIAVIIMLIADAAIGLRIFLVRSETKPPGPL